MKNFKVIGSMFLCLILFGCSSSDSDKLIDQVKLMAQQSYQREKDVGLERQKWTLSDAKYDLEEVYEVKAEDGSYKYVSIFVLEYDVNFEAHVERENRTVYEVYYTVANQLMIVDENGDVSLSNLVEIDDSKSLIVPTAEREETISAATKKAEAEIGLN